MSKLVKKGGKPQIHIKKENEGKFTEAAKRAGMSVQQFARHVLANKDKYSPTLVKRANFARNASKWKHQEGGILTNDDKAFNLFRMTLPSNLAIPDPNYDMRRYWELIGKPATYDLAPKEAFPVYEDGRVHARTIAWNPQTGEGEFMKMKTHPTVGLEFNSYLSPEMTWFRNQYEVVDNGNTYKYVPRTDNRFGTTQYFANGGEVNNPDGWRDYVPDYRKAAGKKSDITFTPQMYDTARRHVDNARAKIQNGEIQSSIITDAYDKVIAAGLSEEEALEAAYNAATSFINMNDPHTKYQLNAYTEKERKDILDAIRIINNQYQPQHTRDSYLQWLKENHPDINPYNSSTFNTIVPKYQQDIDKVRDQSDTKKQQEEQFRKDVQERSGYEGVQKGMIAATILPLIPILGEFGTGASIIKWGNAAIKNLGWNLATQGIGEGIGYGIESIANANDGSIYQYMNEHPILNKGVNYGMDLLSVSGYSLGQIGESLNNPKLQATGNILQGIGSGWDALNGGMAARDITNNGANYNNVSDQVIGLLPSSWSDTQKSVDELVRQISILLGTTNDVIQGSIDNK